MVDDKADDPAQVVRDILADGPVPAPQFRQQCHDQGIPVKDIGKAAKAAGAKHRRHGAPGKGGWVWEIPKGVDRFIKQHPNRRGYYADGIFVNGKEIQSKLADDVETARVHVAKLLADREAGKAAHPPARLPSRPLKKSVAPLHIQIRDIGRQLLRLYRQVQELETAKGTP